MLDDSNIIFEGMTKAEIRKVKAAAEARVAKIEQRLKEFVELERTRQEGGQI